MSGLRPSEADVLLAARSISQHYGRDAATEAARRAENDLARGDRKSSATWQRIMAAIEKLQAEKPKAGGDGAVAACSRRGLITARVPCRLLGPCR
jgi:hypothetical protein